MINYVHKIVTPFYLLNLILKTLNSFKSTQPTNYTPNTLNQANLRHTPQKSNPTHTKSFHNFPFKFKACHYLDIATEICIEVGKAKSN